MFDFVQRNKRIIQFVLAIIFLPFAFFGVESYFQASGTGDAVATVGGHRISQNEFSQALRERQDFIQRLSGGRGDPSRLDTPELRFAVLEQLIQQRLLLDRAIRSGMAVSERQLRDVIAEIPAFQDNGKFSFARYEQLLKAQGMTPMIFEQKVRNDLLLQNIDDAYTSTTFVPRAVAEYMVKLGEEKREISVHAFPADRYLSQVKLEDGAARKYYDGHQDEFRVPEQVRVEYVVLSQEALQAQSSVTAEDLKKYYDEHIRQFEVKETRQAAHILITADSAGGPEAKQKARAKAEEVAKEAQKNPAAFAELAKKYSQDPGSAAKGGDLGTLTRGAMKDVPKFEDVLFSMKAGEVSQPVETQYGFHIIKLVSVRAGQAKSLEQVKQEIEGEVKKQVAGRKFAELAEAFNNTVFEQGDSLKPAADLLKTQPKQSGWITRNGGDDARLSNPRLLQAIFSEEVLRNKRNTEAIEVGPGTIVAARLLEHKPSSVKSFEEVSAGINKKLVQQRATQLAAQEGRAALEKLRAGQAMDGKWSDAKLVGRGDVKVAGEAVLRQAFKAPSAKLPAYTGVEDATGGYTLVRVTKVEQPARVAVEQQKNVAEAMSQMLAQTQFSAYLASLKQKADIKIKQDLVEKKQ